MKFKTKKSKTPNLQNLSSDTGPAIKRGSVQMWDFSFSAILNFVVPLLTIIFFTPTLIHAQGLNLSISPPLLKATIKPGKAISQVFTIYNNSQNPVKLTPRIVPFLPEDDQGNPSLKPQFQPAWISYFSLANSKIFLNQPFTLQPNQSDQLVLSIKIPENATPVDHYATLLLSQGAGGDLPGGGQSETEVSPGVVANENTTSISGSIGANILLTIANQATPPTILKIINFKPVNTLTFKIGQTYFLDNLSPVNFTAKLENLGNHLTESHGLFQIYKGTQTIYIQPLLPINVLSQSTRQIVASTSALPTPGVGSQGLVFHPKITHLGRYQASLIIRSENGSSQDSINLIFFPLKALVGLIFSTIILNFILKKTST